MAKLPGMGWLTSNDQPPVLDSVEGVTVYPPPSAAATPASLSESKAVPPTAGDTPVGYPSTSYPSLSQTASTPSSTPAAAAVPRRDASAAISTTAQPNAALAGGYAPAASTAGTTSTTGGSLAAVPNPSRPAAAELPIGLPPGVTAPDVPTGRNSTPPANYSADIQRGPYSLSETPRDALPQSVATAPTNNYPVPDSGSATTWDYPNRGDTVASQPTAGSYSTASATTDDFETSGVRPIPTVASATPEEPLASHTATASHYESLAAQYASHTQMGPWRPGSTTSYESPLAETSPAEQFQHTGPSTSTASLPDDSSSRDSRFE